MLCPDYELGEDVPALDAVAVGFRSPRLATGAPNDWRVNEVVQERGHVAYVLCIGMKEGTRRKGSVGRRGGVILARMTIEVPEGPEMAR